MTSVNRRGMLPPYRRPIFHAETQQAFETDFGYVKLLGNAERGSGGVFDKNEEGVDAPVTEMGDVHADNGDRPVGWPSLPAQPSDIVMADGRSGRGEAEGGRQAGEQYSHRLGDRRVADYRGFGLIEHGILGIQVCDRLEASNRISLTEHMREIGLHQSIIIEGWHELLR
jgi:hypothetical protein